MKLNNKGFALTSIIYMLIVLFLMILLLILANLAQRKVVLDKIKNDVKTNLNQGGLIAKNTYTVTFDPTIGQINQTSKQVTYNEPYGELPTPTREGYKFIGWTSKNLAPEINESNYTSDHFNNRTTTEFRNENGTNYIRINGNPSNENIDTMWRIYPINGKTLHQGNYVLSFDVRSQNSLLTQNITKKIDRNSGKTGVYIDDATKIDNMISTIENDYNFDNDGQWHHFTSLVTIPYDISNALIVIGNDKPNLYGTNSYLDIKNIQLERGDTATSYEPYQEYTSDTIVTKQENHTLYAMWEPLYTVTFDPDGGTLLQTSKEVSYHEPYGELPTPTREGYTFMGWNGKNMFELKENIDWKISGEISTNFIENSVTFIGTNWVVGEYYLPTLKKNTNYSISANVELINLDHTYIRITKERNLNNGNTFILNKQVDDGYFSSGFLIDDNDETTAALAIYGNLGKSDETGVKYSNIQIEEGNTVTEYEPYYIKPSTTVVQEKDHTLKAIWQANE